MHQAVKNDKADVIDYLLKHGANPLLADDTGATCLAMTQDEDVTKLLNAAIEAKRWTKFRKNLCCRNLDDTSPDDSPPDDSPTD